MKKLLLSSVAVLLTAPLMLGGGIVTNTNQSASWVRTMSRNASTGIDAVYFNPAGLGKLNNGLHFSLNNQTILQNKDVTTTFNYLSTNPFKYEGKVSAPVFPGVYAVYKMDKLAFSFGFNPVGGGGGAKYDNGLPSFEVPLSTVVPTLQGSLAPLDQAILGATGTDPQFRNVTGYRFSTYFEGTSVFFGYQVNASYQLTEMLGVALGARYVTAKNTYKGFLKSYQINAPASYGGWQTPGNYLRTVANTPGLDAVTKATLQGTAAVLDVQTGDKEVDVEQTGTGFTPLLGVHFSPMEKLNIALKYEFKTGMKVKTSINDNKDGGGLFKKDSTINSDMPAMLAAGIDYNVLPALKLSVSYNYYFDKNADYGKSLEGQPVANDKVIDKNFYEIAVGAEYSITEKLVISAGFLHAQTGVTKDYQSDQSFSLTSNTIGGGLLVKLNDRIGLNLGYAYTMYDKGSKDYTVAIGPTNVPAKDEYAKKTMIFSAGIDISLSK